MKRLFKAITLSLVALLLVSMPVLAAVSYRASYTIVESDGNAYDMLPTSVLVDNQWLADNGFMQDDALDTRIETLGGSIKPHMVATNKTLTAVPVPADSQTNLYFTTANTDLSATEIIGGYGSYITIDDDATLELGSDFEIEQLGYVDTTGGADVNLVHKQYAFRTYIDGANAITSEILEFPEVAAENGGQNNVAGLNHTVNLPANIRAGNLLLVFFCSDADPGIGWPGGWTELFDDDQGAVVAFAAAYRVADGTEGATIVVTTGNAQQTAHTSYSITGYSGVPEVGTSATGIGVNPDPPSLTPSWGLENTLWFASCGYEDDADALTAYPTDYTDGRNDKTAGIGTAGASVGSARRELSAVTEDPGTFTFTNGDDWVANTVAIQPADLEVTATPIASGEYTVKTYGVDNEPEWATGDVLHFTGANTSNINVGDIGDGNKLWISLWFNLDTAIPDGGSGTDQYLIGKYTDADEFLLVWIEGTNGQIYMSHDEVIGLPELIATTETAWALGWHHILASCSTVAGQRLIADGGAAVVSAGNVTAISQTPSDFCIGARDDGVNAEGFIGEIQNVILGIGDLSAPEEVALYAGIAPTGANAPTEYWYIDEGTGTVITSYGSVATTGTADAACTWETATYTTGSTGRLCDFYIEVDDGVLAPDRWGDNLKGASVPGNANDWVLNQNNVMPWMDYYKHTVGGVEVTWYQPDYMVEGTDHGGTTEAGTDDDEIFDATLTEAPSYWLEGLVTITSGARDGETSVCSIYAVGHITVDPAFSGAIGIGETYTIDFATLIDRRTALDFNPATPDYITIPADQTQLNFTSGDFSGILRIYVDNLAVFRVPFMRGEFNVDGYMLFLFNNGAVQFYTSQTPAANQSTSTAGGEVVAETWYTIGWSRTGASVTLFKNGVDVTSAPVAHIDPTTSSSPATVGVRSDLVTDPYDGKIEFVMIYDRALGDAEHLYIHNNSAPQSESGLALWLKLDEGTGSTAGDSSSYESDGTITGATWVENNSRITWGVNPTGVAVTLGGMVSEGQPTLGALPSDPAQDILPETEVTDWYIEPDVTGTLLTNPLRPFVTMWSDNSTLTELQCWRLYALAFILLVTVATAMAVGHHQGITMIAAGVALLGAVVLTIFPMWALVFAIGMFIGGLVMERSPSL